MQRPVSRLDSIAFLIVMLTLLVACGAATKQKASPSAASETKHGASESAEAAPRDEDEDEADGDVEAEDAPTDDGPCPHNMVLVDGRYCIDKYEASLVETADDGTERPYAHYLPVDGHVVRAVSEPEVFPQGYISEVQAEDACAASGKRLCSHVEWKTACMGPAKTTFPYGDARQPGTCHDTGKSAVGAVFGAKALADPVASAPASSPANGSKAGPKTEGRRAHVTVKGRAAETTRTRPSKGSDRKRTAKADSRKPSAKGSRSPEASRSGSAPAKKPRRAAGRASAKPASVEASVWTKLNDPALGQVDGALAKTGSHAACVNGYGVVDMVGNLHEWVATDSAAPHGTFAGGYYLDTSINGDGCNYRTVAHAHEYHDYSTGFRCCAAPKQR